MREANPIQSGPVTGSKTIRVMIVDDSLIARTVLRKMVEQTPDFVLSATANTAEEAIAKLAGLNVDVVLLDLEMPGRGGLAALPEILTCAGGAKVMIVSSLTSDGAEATMKALSMGAADTILKPRPGEFTPAYRTALADRIRIIGNTSRQADAERLSEKPKTLKLQRSSGKQARVIAIGASTGGIHSMCQMLSQLPKNFDLPVLVTQHLPAAFIPVFARQLELASGLKANTAEDGSPIVNGKILIAPGDGHMMIERRAGKNVVKIARHAAPSGCCPSVDPMLESLAEVFDGAVLVAILSGMGRDGEIGARAITDKGGTVLAQNPETCAVWGMPRAVAQAGIASAILPPEELGLRIANCKAVPAWS